MEMLVLKALILFSVSQEWKSFDISISNESDEWQKEFELSPENANDSGAFQCHSVESFPSVAASCLLRAKVLCLAILTRLNSSDPFASTLRGLLGYQFHFS
jgi:hypothetical protein